MDSETKTSKRRPRREFTAEFKAGAVRLVIEEGRSLTDVARSLDLVPSALRNWVLQAKADAGSGAAGALTSSERDELVRLRRELRQTRMERDILKKQRPSSRKRAREIHVHPRGEGHLADPGDVQGPPRAPQRLSPAGSTVRSWTWEADLV